METVKENGYERELSWQEKFDNECGEFWKSITVNKDYNKIIQEEIENGKSREIKSVSSAGKLDIY